MSHVKIVLISPSIWKKNLFHGDGADAQLGYRILEAFHEQHVGITSELAQDLARVILSGNPQTTAWKTVIDRLRKTWMDMLYPKTGTTTNRLSRPFTNNASARFWMYRIGLPLIAAACKKIGVSAIWCEEKQNEEFSQYQSYSRRLAEALEEMAQKKGAIPEAYWRDRVLSLMNLTDKSLASSDGVRMPAVSVVEAAMALRDPVEHLAEESEEEHAKLTLQRVMFDPRRHEAGARGVQFSQREADIPRMLPSEWLYDEIIRLDRLINTGFLVTKRPPVPVQMRDALIVGICPPQLMRSPLAPFIRAVWFDFAARATVLLARSGLNKSELRWIEARPENKLRSISGVVGQIPANQHIESRDPNSDISARTIFARSLGWYPSLFDRRSAADAQFDASDADPANDVQRWFSDALAQQRDALYWDVHEETAKNPASRSRRNRVSATSVTGFSSRRLALERFRMVHVMHMLPALSESDDAYSNFLVHYRSNSHTHPITSQSITSIPPQWGESGWGFYGMGLSIEPLTLNTEDTALHTVKMLMSRWMLNLAEVLQNV